MSNENNREKNPRPGFNNVFISDLPRAYRFICAMNRLDTEDLEDPQKHEIHRICELFQNSASKVSIEATKDRTIIEISAYNLEDPESHCLLWTCVKKLVGGDAQSLIQIYNLDSSGDEVISTEQYIISDIVFRLDRSYRSPEPQMIKIRGTVVKEIIVE